MPPEDSTLSIFAGTGKAAAPTPGPATSSALNIPNGIAFDSSGNVYIVDSNNNVVEKVTPSGILSIFAGTGKVGTPTPGPATSSDLNGPGAVGFDSAGNAYIADSGNNVVEKVTPSGRPVDLRRHRKSRRSDTRSGQIVGPGQSQPSRRRLGRATSTSPTAGTPWSRR